LHTRFKQGQSGTPFGRRRRPRSLAGELLAALQERAEIAGPDGKPRKTAKRRFGVAGSPTRSRKAMRRPRGS
jgi:hypothetical protein